MKLRFILFLSCFLMALKGHSQDSLLSYEAFLQQVRAEHPLLNQVRLLNQQAELYELKARGNMDPKLNSDWKYKQFDSKNYYDLFDTYVKIPTIVGLDVKGGYHWARGDYTNNMDNLPAAGQAYLGVELPLLQGLWNNERQTQLRQAKLLITQSEFEIQNATNDLLYQAAKDYWNWCLAYNQEQIFVESLRLTDSLLTLTKGSYAQDDIAGIDTLKVLIRKQEYQVQLQEAQLQVIKTQLDVANHLWISDTMPAQIAEKSVPQALINFVPEPIDTNELNRFIGLVDNHPALRTYQYQMQGLELDRRFKQTKLLPKASVSYNFLSVDNANFFNGSGLGALAENYKFGVKFSYPLLIRKERADLQLNRLKQKQTEFKYFYKKQEISNKVKKYYNEVNGYRDQIATYQQMVANYATLVAAEQEKFRLGESDVFLVNTFQQQFVEAQLKLNKKIISYLKSRTAWAWATAQLQ